MAAGKHRREPRCGECRMGLGSHNLADPLCELPESATHRAWLAGVDNLLAQGVDPFVAIVEADPRSAPRRAEHSTLPVPVHPPRGRR